MPYKDEKIRKLKQKERNLKFRMNNPHYNSEYLKKYRKEYNYCNPEYYQNEKWRKYFRLRTKKYNLNNPLKYKARYTLRNSIVAGKIIRPNKCSKCFSSTKPEAHHHDYTKPLDVKWLCKPCHIKEDKKVV